MGEGDLVVEGKTGLTTGSGYKESRIAPVRPEMVAEISDQLDQTWMASGTSTPNWEVFGRLMFAAQKGDWKVSELAAGLDKLKEEKGIELQITPVAKK